MRTPNEIIDEIERIRGSNNTVWMRLVRLAWELDPTTARSISSEITKNDAKILTLSTELAAHDAETLGRELAASWDSYTTKSAKLRVLLPGGGILHTWAVKEALALGLIPVVTDRDPDCPCAKIPGVEFHEIDCYDEEKFAGLAFDAAFCGGADTHVVVARAHDILGERERRWVTTETARTCKDKLLAKQALLRAGVPTARLSTGVGRAIWKPRSLSGSRGVRQVDCVNAGSPEGPGENFYEEFLEGPEQSVEVLLGPYSRAINIVDRHFVWVDDQPLEVGHTNPTRLDELTQKELYNLAYSAAAAVGAKAGFFKIDSILTKDGPKVLECTPRLSGGYDSQLSTPLSSGRNLLRYGLQLACGMEPDPKLLERTKADRVTVIHRPELASAELFA